jgi:hypothetical protein
MFGANATATPDGHLLQLRALDWDVDGNATRQLAPNYACTVTACTVTACTVQHAMFSLSSSIDMFLPQGRSRITHRLLSTIQTLKMATPLPTLAGQLG